MIHELRDGDCVMFGVDVTMNEEGLAQLDSYLSKNFGPKGDRSVTFIAIPGLDGLHVLRKSSAARVAVAPSDASAKAVIRAAVELKRRMTAIREMHKPGSEQLVPTRKFCPACFLVWPCDTWKLADGGGDDAK